MRFTEAHKREVVDTASATTVGHVHGFVVDPVGQRVSGLRIGRRGKEFLPWDDVSSFGVDAVTVDGDDRVRSAQADDGTDQPDLVGHRVLDEHGVEHGTVQDVEFDPGDGSLRYLLTSTEEVDGARLLGVGTWAVVVTVPQDATPPPDATTPPPAPDTTA